MQIRVADSVIAGALRVLFTAGQAIPGGFIAVGEAAAPEAVAAAIAQIHAYPALADFPRYARAETRAAEAWIRLGVHAVERASVEAGRTEAFMGPDVADLLVSDALIIVCAATDALARRFIAVCESRTHALERATITQICADARFARESVGARVVASTAVAKVSERVHAFFVAKHQGRLAFESAVRTAVRPASRRAWELRVGRQKRRVVDDLEVRRTHTFVYAGWRCTRRCPRAAAAIAFCTGEPRAGTVDQHSH